MRIFQTNADYPLRFLSCGVLRSQQNFIHQRRTFNASVLILVTEGSLYIAQNQVPYTVCAGQFIILPAGEEHYGFQPTEKSLSYYWVHFNPRVNEHLIQTDILGNKIQNTTTSSKEYPYFLLPEYGDIISTQKTPILFNKLLDLSLNNMLYSQYMLDYCLSLLIMEVSQEFLESTYQITNKIPKKIALIITWIRENYDKNISVSQIAREFGYHPDYLAFLFKKSTGQTLIHFINTTRIEISKTLLLNTDVTIKEAAYSCGFSDEKYFMKTFKKIVGLTPSQYKHSFHFS